MKNSHIFIKVIGLFVFTSLACQSITGVFQPTTIPTPTLTATPTILPTPQPPPAITIEPTDVGRNPNELVFISGKIPYTSPFFLNTISEPFVLLEDEAGFVQRDREFKFPLEGQVIGAVEVHEDQTLTYSLSLPAQPQGTQVDVDNNGKEDLGVQVFAIAYWSNTWGGPFLEQRDGTGWSTAYASTITDPERDNEISGGTLLVWAPDGEQGFPSGFGDDKKLFTPDDPIAPIPSGYNLVDLNQEPFKITKEAKPEIDLNEGDLAVTDLSKMSYSDAFEALFNKASKEYPFTQEKGIDWKALHDEFAPRVASAQSADDFYRALRDFTYAIPDAHVGLSFNADVFYQERGGSFGLVLTELSDSRVIVTNVIPGTPGAEAGIQTGAEIITWDNLPVKEAISQVNPYFGPFSTEVAKRLEQVVFLTRVPPDTKVSIEYQNPDVSQPREVTLQATVEYQSLFDAMPDFSIDQLAPPDEGRILEGSGLGYIRITTFSEDYNLMAHIWDRFIGELINNQVPGLIIDLRVNSGGSFGLALDFTGYFFDHEITVSRSAYYNELTGKFEYQDYPSRIKPGPKLYDGPIAVLVSPYCVSACEGFANALNQEGRSVIVGHYPTAGGYGEVGRGQYKLPGDISLQFPTGRSETPDGKLLIEGKGVPLDITVPVTEESATGKVDAVLQAAIEVLSQKIK